MSDNIDTELALLESVYSAQKREEHLTQRELAQKSGLSLGMTNALLKKLADRGWLSLTRLSAKSLHYALTPEGIGEVSRRTVGYFRKASSNASHYRERVESIVLDAKARGFSSLILVGSSDIDFLLEWSCERHGLVFLKCAEPERARRLAESGASLIVWAEGAGGGGPTGGTGAGRAGTGPNEASLHELITAH